MNQDYTIGIDLGGTKIDIAAIEMEKKNLGNSYTSNYRIIEKIRIPTHVTKRAEGIISDIADIVYVLEKKLGAKARCLGIAAAGQIDVAGEVVKSTPNLLLDNTPLKKMLEDKLLLEVALLNDVRAATIGEYCFGAGKGVEDFVCLFVGTGIGGGIVSKGHLLKGSNNSAGELGHIVVSFDGSDLCGCGNTGCLESIASGFGIAQKAKALALQDKELCKQIFFQAGGEVVNISAKHVFLAALQQDLVAKQILQRALQALVAGCITIVNSLNPKKLIFGGGIMYAEPMWLEVIKGALQKRALQTASHSLEVVFGDLKENAGVIGAAAVANGGRHGY